MSVTYVQARDAIATLIYASLTSAYPSMEVFYENTRQVDLIKVAAPFLRVAIDFQVAQQASIELSPITRVHGEVTFEVWCKEGSGTSAGLALFDYLHDVMRHQTVSGVVLETPTPGRKRVISGWEIDELNVPFHFHN